MIVTLTLNPSLDLTYTLAESALGDVDVHRASAATIEGSGKGVNVARDLHAAGSETIAVIPVGGPTGRHLAELLGDAGVPHLGVPVAGETRINTSVLLPGGTTVKVNGPGEPMVRADVDRLLESVDAVLTGLTDTDDSWLVISGSLPPGLEPAVVGEFVGVAARHTVKCAVDIAGAALAVALRTGANLLAPNEIELAELLRTDLGADTVTVTAAAARRLAADHGVDLLVSMGRSGAVYTDGEVVIHGGGPALVPVNTAGAGDAFLAGWLAGPGTPADRMRRALAWGRSACLCPTTVDPHPGTRGVDGITVTTLSDTIRDTSKRDTTPTPLPVAVHALGLTSPNPAPEGDLP